MLSIAFDNKDSSRIAAALAGLAAEMPKVMEVSINGTASAAKRGIIDNMKSVFDRPTPATLNSLFVRRATVDNLEASVHVKDTGGIDYAKWLTPETFGGERRAKGAEVLLRRKGILPASSYLVPSQYAPYDLFDRFGNIKSSVITQMLSGLSANRDVGVQSNITKRSAKRNKSRSKFYVIGGKSSPQGIGMRKSGNEMDVLFWFVRKPNYKPRLDFHGVGQRIVEAELPIRIGKALQQAIAYHARRA